MATNTVDEYYQAVKIQFANELPMAGVGLGSGYSKMSGNNSADWAFAMPAFASYEVDLFLKNHDKTNASKNNMKQHCKMKEQLIFQSHQLLVQHI